MWEAAEASKAARRAACREFRAALTRPLMKRCSPSGVVGSWPGPPAPPPACPVALAAAYLAPEEPGVGGQPPSSEKRLDQPLLTVSVGPGGGGKLRGPPSTVLCPLCTFGSDDVMARLAAPCQLHMSSSIV